MSESVTRPNSALYPKKKTREEVEANRQKILDMARNACSNAGGYALVDGRYAFIDTNVYTAVHKDK